MHISEYGKKILSLAMLFPILSTAAFSFTGCGSAKTEGEGSTEEVINDTNDGSEDTYSYVYDNDVTTEWQYSEYTSESDDEYYESDEMALVDMMKSRPVTYETQNVFTKSEKLSSAPIEVSIKNYCDLSAIQYAEEHNCMDYLLWLADFVVNSVEPQAVEKLLQLPVFADAAESGEVSRYISIYLTFNDVNAFGAMEQSCYMGKDGHGLAEWDSPFYYIGHNVLINLNSFPPDSKDDPYTRSFLESAMIHEMMHAFVTDYLFNLSLGTGRDGLRVLERDANGKVILNEEERPNLLDEGPTWFQEGIAMTVENPYGTRCNEIKDLFDSEATDDDYLFILSTPEIVNSYINLEYSDGEIINIAKISDSENTYTTGWIATMFLCAMAGHKLGYEIFDQNGILNNDAVFYGLNELIKNIRDGHSLDYVISDISYSYDPTKGYKDTTDFEERCFGSVDDPGLIFMQKLLLDLESRSIADPENYMPTASALPGYVNGAKLCMDGSYHSPAKVYEVDNILENNPAGDYFSISTIPLANVALSGGRRTSYDPYLYPLSAEEAAERNYGYIGDRKKYIDLSLEDE
ncbi:MAG: hypothetical protein II842_12270 [Butyrivibrio sp.]|nr:hypothetical protein [Butyrivibrio sp.]